MYISLLCPNEACTYHASAVNSNFRKKGYYKTKYDSQKVPRYQCKACGQFFSTKSMLGAQDQKRPDLNEEIFNLYCSGTTMRRMAILLGCSRVTVARKLTFLAERARKYHDDYLSYGLITSREVAFDEMEAYEHTKLKPLAIALAVCVESGRIIDIAVSPMNAKGKIAAKSKALYKGRVDTRYQGIDEVMKAVKKCMPANSKLVTDGSRHYTGAIKEFLPPSTIHKQVPMRNLKKGSSPEAAAIQYLNHRCARLRSDVSRLRRSSWVTTKDHKRLQQHLDLYVAYLNGYSIRDIINQKCPGDLVA